MLLFLALYRGPRDLPPSPTRRSSDLTGGALLSETEPIVLPLARKAGGQTQQAEASARRGGIAFDRQELAQILNIDRKSTRLNSSHLVISYAVFCLKKKKC